MRVLVVDDHAETRKLLVRSLERASYGVKAAASCEEAEAAIGQGEFDVVVLDVMLPDGSGIDLCGRFARASCGYRSFSSPRGARSGTAWPGWTLAPTTISSSRSRSRSCWRG